uniref:phosphate ABC transporter permease PstA n=1 Tax=Halomonas sp. TaxID=1486246 RepID=UPI0026099C59|nr:phosphate ABC transporter permease PstA [Halomonas sp.]
MKIPGHAAATGASRRWQGEGPWAWLSAAAVALSLLMLGALLVLLATRGLGHFWPADLHQLRLADGQRLIGVPVETRQLPDDSGYERRYFTANRDHQGGIWTWVAEDAIEQDRTPNDLIVLQRGRWGAFFGRLVAVVTETERFGGDRAWQALRQRLDHLEELRQQSESLRRDHILPLIRQMERMKEHSRLSEQLTELEQQALTLQRAMTGTVLVLETADGKRFEQPLESVLDAWHPNSMGSVEKLAHWSRGVWQFLSEGPRDANAAGGVWPAIFGTVLMVMLMSLLVTPFGVLAAVYLNEVAHQGRLTRWVRIGVRNLAGVPSIVYGVFGLGVFVYGIGGSLDRLFYADTLPSPTFGTGGLLWASLTLALLTLPVVIVATEEGLARIPLHQREGALALGATHFETLTRVVLPMATPAMLTGVILAVARAAGEVAPLMLVGVAKLAPQVPVDGEFPFLHLERKFMHLGYHIYDAAFHSNDVQAALPLVYATALLLVLVILVLNLTAIFLRHYLRLRHGVPVRR